MTGKSKTFVFATICVAVFLRATISLNSYSGEAKPPMFGDYEAQRHWQEVTVNLPIKDWYEQTEKNDLQYWGLDYPPLTAYHSYAMGKIAEKLNPQFVALNESRGITTADHKLFMRVTVIVADLVVYIPAVLLACFAVYDKLQSPRSSEITLNTHILLFLVYAGQMLIDNGHFQYNNISLGLALLAVVQILRDRNLIAALFFVLSLNYKQMELYHALPFFFYLLAKCFHGQSFLTGVRRLITLGGVVVTTFLALWWPWLHSKDSALQVLHRIFPVARGVFEDKVSNIWCIVNVVYKIRDHFTNEKMAIICLTCTIAAVLPSCMNLLLRPQKNKFILALINSSLAFFLFSFQVHEKTILLVALPVLLQFAVDPFACLWFLQISTFSMLPLLIKDGLLSAYLGLTVIFTLLPTVVSELTPDRSTRSHLDFLNMRHYLNFSKPVKKVHFSGGFVENLFLFGYYCSLLGSVALIAGYLWVPPPAHLPFLFPLLISAFSCLHFVGFFLYFNFKQLFG